MKAFTNGEFKSHSGLIGEDNKNEMIYAQIETNNAFFYNEGFHK